MMDAKTAVALARMPNVNPHFFLKPPYYHLQYSLDVYNLLALILNIYIYI